MSDSKMLQAIFDRIVVIDKKVDRVETKVDRNGERIDKLGDQIAYLEDDAPTNVEFNKLKKRVTKIEKIIAS